jgi:hypothetical protein
MNSFVIYLLLIVASVVMGSSISQILKYERGERYELNNCLCHENGSCYRPGGNFNLIYKRAVKHEQETYWHKRPDLG